MRRPLSALLLAAAVAVTVAACGESAEESAPEPGADVQCEQVEAPEPKDVDLQRPSLDPPPEGTVAVFETNCGSFTVDLAVERAPKTSASFAHLVEEGVYDDTAFHRVAPGFVIQGGDPRGDGTGGPGYSVTEEPPQNLSYTEGTVAMAKTEAEPPGRSGSQFYVVTGADAGLPPDFALVGEVSDGMNAVRRIEALGPAGGDGPPSTPVVIERARLERG